MNRISFIIPAYNAGKYIKRCIDSIISLNLDDYEIIVVNDGSSDNTSSIVNHMANTNERVMVIDKENEGVSAARNDGMDKATGDFIMFVDADDYLTDSFASSLKRGGSFEPDDLMIFGMDRKSRNGDVSKWNYESHRYTDSEILNLLMDMDALPLGSPCAKLFKTSILKGHNIRFNPGQKLFEDACFVYNYLKHCRSVLVSDISIYFYDTSGSVSSGFYGEVFFRDFTEYLRAQKDLIEHLLSRKPSSNVESSNALTDVLDERNSFQHVATLYKLYRSSSTEKRQWLEKCLSYANSTDPQWYKYRNVGLPKYVAKLRNHPVALHIILSFIFKIESIKNRHK